MAHDVEERARAALNKSDGMRVLFAVGYKVADVARVMGVDYAFAYGVAKRAGVVGAAAIPRRAAAIGAPPHLPNRTRSPVFVLSEMTPNQVREAVAGFAARYVRDWDEWLAVTPRHRTALFGLILGRWQATHGHGVRRRTRLEAKHRPPYMDDLIASADAYVTILDGLTLSGIRQRNRQQAEALDGLWNTFRRLTTNDNASCVAISKAVLLMTNGRLGPALDRNVRKSIRVPRPADARQWLRVLDHAAEDIALFERSYGSLRSSVPTKFRHLEVGRLYDMALGPRPTAED